MAVGVEAITISLQDEAVEAGVDGVGRVAAGDLAAVLDEHRQPGQRAATRGRDHGLRSRPAAPTSCRCPSDQRPRLGEHRFVLGSLHVEEQASSRSTSGSELATSFRKRWRCSIAVKARSSRAVAPAAAACSRARTEGPTAFRIVGCQLTEQLATHTVQLSST